MNGDRLRILFVCGARPNYMKVAPVMAAVRAWNDLPVEHHRVCLSQVLVHTGQHYDPGLSDIFFAQLGLPEPDYHLDVGSGSHAAQTAHVLERLEPVLLEEKPDVVVVVGDVNSTIAAALCAAKIGIPVAHVEAGLRSGDRSMPEELNRLLTDQLADLLFITEQSAVVNLSREGIDACKVYFVGNTMIDTLDRLLPRARTGDVLRRLRLTPRHYGLVTLHRPANVDDSAQLRALVDVLRTVAERIPLVWPVHPRTRAKLATSLLTEEREVHDGSAEPRLLLTEPLGYLEFLQLMDAARLMLTDSGGVQEETTVLGVPCLTLRTTTERPVTIDEGTNRLVDPYDAGAIVGSADAILAAPTTRSVRPEMWDGRAAERIVGILADWAGGKS
jgi:UDP-N-acetylglucosamine 2-epimerase (non-hydrolysing)